MNRSKLDVCSIKQQTEGGNLRTLDDRLVMTSQIPSRINFMAIRVSALKDVFRQRLPDQIPTITNNSTS